MSACDTCSKPGHCCKDFQLHTGTTIAVFRESDWEERGAAYAKRYGLPFKPLRIDHDQKWNEGNEPEPGNVALRWMCPNLTPEGRCGDYENRPALCRNYAPLSDRLCAMYVEPVTSDQL